ncbi:membrane protein insertase YidC [Polluticaenibacter yanchengensis]|uniref:Membrane protein insertase YidC n=1 Tax=Polluticaenibacter yanchengensis TaxID=3014562 RepID=A0ABT4UH33_9BACT|nr:membrane protein insertase YidC [Chitinophagaceae bacterium LY-5]
MGFDRNTLIGFGLLAVLLMGMFWQTTTTQKAQMAEKKRISDSIAALQPKVDSLAQKQQQAVYEQKKDSVNAGDFVAFAGGEETFSYVENDVMKLTFSNKGGWLKKVELKNFKGPDSGLVVLSGSPKDNFNYVVRTGAGVSQDVNRLFFSPAVITKNADGSQTISYQIAAEGKSLSHAFLVPKDNYMVDANIKLDGADQFISKQSLNFTWDVLARRQQHDKKYENNQTRLVVETDNEYDYFSAASGVTKTFGTATKWIGLKQHFFNSTLLANNAQGFSNVTAAVVSMPDTVHNEIAVMQVNASMQIPAGNVVEVPLRLYYGPNEYKLLKSYDNDMHNIVDLGSGITAFVKYINRGIIMPVFNMLNNLFGTAGMGWSILVLTIFIRLLITPLTYSSYKSAAKMKALRPDIEKLNEKFGDNAQAKSMEQMKLYREAGVNPAGGCLPALMQIPIFFALFAFFNSNIALRGVPFLWADDLSNYDSIAQLPFTIPFYGDHVSLFTITAVITSFAISLYSMNSAPDTGNPMMKYMPYIFPFMMLFFFNSMPAALTWYYTVSNIITLLLQFVIQNYVIDNDKIHEQIKANRAAPKKKSKLQERIAQMQESQRKLEEMKKRSQGK